MSSIIYPTKLGGFISAFNSGSISNDLESSGLPVGTKIFNQTVGSFFTLTTSTESLVTDEILAVKGIVGQRWIKDTAIPQTGWNKIVTEDDATDIDITGLNGDVDQVYEVICRFPVGGVGNPDILLRPNAVSSNQLNLGIYSAAGDPNAHQTTGANLYVGVGTAGGEGSFMFTFIAKTGLRRFFYGSYLSLSNVGTVGTYQTTAGVWDETVTNVTSLRLHASAADGFGSGTEVYWRAVPPN